MEDVTIGFIGAGNMAKSIIKGVVASKTFAPDKIYVSSPSGPKLGDLGVHCTTSNVEVAQKSSVLVLAVKPFNVGLVLQSMFENTGVDSSFPLIISIAAGIQIDQIVNLVQRYSGSGSNAVSGPVRVIRLMPNLPCQVGEGVCGMAGNQHVTEFDVQLCRRIFESVSTIFLLKEPQLDAVTSLGGSGPAFVMMFLEALADGGVASGLSRQVAIEMAVQMVKGSAILLQQSGVHSAEIKDRVASPSGTTIEGIKVLENSAFRGTVMSAVLAATKKCAEMRS
jgi:pyrroline-5-carboxylate reductase